MKNETLIETEKLFDVGCCFGVTKPTSNVKQEFKNSQDTILDSSLILATSTKIYDIKLVECGEYKQVYYFNNKMVKKAKKEDNKELTLSKKSIINQILSNLSNKEKLKKDVELKFIESRNINRSKLSCQRIAKANMNVWKSFITLTFKENITDINLAYKRFKYFVDKIRRVKKDFKYLGIREFQKRGAIHYHLLTNIECDSLIIPKRPLKHLYKPSIKKYVDLEYYAINYWLDGFSSAEPIKNDPKKIIGYISKYMTKDIDNRLFTKHRYFYSRNLETPKISYINSNDSRDMEFLNKKIQDKQLIYKNQYLSLIDNNLITFHELQ